MRRYRLFIALMVALSMLLTMGVTAGAAPFSDVDDDSEYASALQLLKDLAIFEGYGDGTVGPDDPLTREQFAVIVVRALGATDAANNLSNFVTHFSDDAQISDWARGAVAYASARIVQGYPDGSFQPQANVTYAEAYAMLIRALRLDEAIQGPWPIGVINLANELGLNEGIAGAHDAPMTRGDMALATQNALFLSVRWDRENAELVWDDDGSLALIVDVHGWSEDDWLEQMEITRVTGRVERITAAGEIRLDGRNYAVDDYATLEVELNKDAEAAEDATKNNPGDPFPGWSIDTLRALLDAVDEDHVVLTLDRESGKVKKVHVVVNTFENYQLTRVNLDQNETDFGQVRLQQPNQTAKVIKVTDGTEVFLNGSKATLAQVLDALADFRGDWGNDANAIATVRTAGNDESNLGTEAIWLSVITDKLVAGTVTARGSDSGGKWARIDGTKYYTETDDLEVDDEVTVLLGHDDKIYVVLGGVDRVDSDTWARVLGYTVDSQGRYTVTLRRADDTQFTLRIAGDDQHDDGGTNVYWQHQIDVALADDEMANLIFLHFDGGDLAAMVAYDNWTDHGHPEGNVTGGTVTSISSTIIDVDPQGAFTLAPDVFYWDLDNEEVIQRADISAGDQVIVFVADGVVQAVIRV